jgi:hypothetical protein
VSDQICLHCEQPLALIQRLSGDTEFCSKEHRRLYYQERERLALARLLESAPKRPATKVPPPPPKPVLVEEPFEMEEPTIMSLEAFAAQVNRKPEPAPNAAKKGEVKRPEPEKKADPLRKASPDPAGFARANGVEPRSKAALPKTDGPVEAIEWKPAVPPASRPKADVPGGVVFLSPGSFLPLRTRFAALTRSESEPSVRLDAAAFPLRGAELQALRERLRRADRVGFGPA